MAREWRTGTDLSAIAQWLRGKSRIVVVTHGKPDGDAMGSVLAASRALSLAAEREGRDIEVTPCFSGPMPVWHSDLTGDARFLYITHGVTPPDADAVLIVDTGSWTQLDDVRGWLEARTDRTAILDHHQQGDAEISDRLVVDTSAAAACEIVAELACHLLRCASAKELPVGVATPLYLGIATDTGWFKFSNVTSRTMRLAADLLDAGVDHSQLYETVEQQDRSSRYYLLGRALSSMELIEHESIALLTISQGDVHAVRAGPEDVSQFSAYPMSISGVRVCAMLTEVHTELGSPPLTKVSLRSKPASRATFSLSFGLYFIVQDPSG